MSTPPPWQILHGDCLEILPTLDADSIDSVVTDPPYGLSFMGKHWDYDVPKADVWAEVLRVLKPGGHLLSFFGSRTYHRGVCQIEDGGFEIRDSLAWMYGTGFPKSLNVGKAIDAAAGHQREIVGHRAGGSSASAGGVLNMNGRDSVNGSARDSRLVPVTEPSEAAKQWEGFGTALKPAHEPLVLARKPLIGTVAANVLAHGTGALNVDGCRIEGTKRDPGFANSLGHEERRPNTMSGGAMSRQNGDGLGRWPANVCLDEEAAAMLDAQSGEMRARGNVTPTKRNGYASTSYQIVGEPGRTDPGDSGGASRFFYTAKASRDERDGGLELLPAATGGEATSRQDGTAGLNSPRSGAGRTGGSRNTHPTVKPVSLMRWLVRLVTPPGGLVLDPFAGSASTGVAALHEGLRFLGIERGAEYVEMARERLTAWTAVHQEFTTIKARAAGQMPLFAKANP